MSTALVPVPAGVGLRLSDVAALGHASAATLRRRIREGALPARRVGNSFRVDLADVERLYPRPSASGCVDPVDAAVAELVADAPPLSEAQIDCVVAAFGDALRRVAGVRPE